MPNARAESSINLRCASTSSGIESERISGGMTRSVRSYTRSKFPRRVDVVICPAQKSHSSMRFESLHSHQPVLLFSKSDAESGPSPRMRRRTSIASVPPLVREYAEALVAGGARVRPCHAPPEERMERERQERRLVGPVLEEPSLSRTSPRGAVEDGSVVAAEPGESRQIVGAGEHVHAVNLVEAQTLDGAAEVAIVDPRCARLPEPLRTQGDPPGFGD